MIFAYDHQGNILTDRVPCGTSVTAVYYHDWVQNSHTKMHKNQPDLLDDGLLILHNNAHLHHTIHMSPQDFDLFHKLKEPMSGHHFPSLEEVSAAVTRAI
jgi:hypothetical protein